MIYLKPLLDGIRPKLMAEKFIMSSTIHGLNSHLGMSLILPMTRTSILLSGRSLRKPTKKCRHYCRTWYRGGTLEKPVEMWRCDGCLIEGQLDALEEEIEKVILRTSPNENLIHESW